MFLIFCICRLLHLELESDHFLFYNKHPGVMPETFITIIITISNITHFHRLTLSEKYIFLLSTNDQHESKVEDKRFVLKRAVFQQGLKIAK